MKTVKRGALLFAISIVSSCSGSSANPPTALLPPEIEFAGPVASTNIGDSSVEYVLADGRRLNIPTAGRRPLMGVWDGQLVVLGHDERGEFVATYPTQQGLPANCYVDPAPGIDRGAYVEMHTVLWAKSAAFVPAQFAGVDFSYPQGTRFCFDADGKVARTVAP